MNHDERDLEWQRRYEQNDTPWDRGSPAPPLLQFLAGNEISGRVLVPGCGRGHEVRALAGQSNSSVVGLDLSPTAIAQAEELSASLIPDANVSFVEGDFLNLPPAMTQSFDWVVEHTCFCAIDPSQRQDYVLAAASALRSGGRVFAIFFIDPDTETGPPFAVSRKELGELFDPHFSWLEEWIPKESFPGRENRELVAVLRKR